MGSAEGVLMKTIWKSILKLTDRQIVDLPHEPGHLTVQMQNDKICLWSIVETENSVTGYPVIIVGTGNPFPEEAGRFPYIGSVQHTGFVWHVFADQS
jgi:hypothetical protein